MIQRYTSVRYVPTVNRASNDGSGTTIIRGSNLFIRGLGGSTYSEVYAGSLDLNETIATSAITGTIAFSPSSKTITGTGTSFVTELHIGQRIETLAGEILVVAEIASATSFSVHNYPLTTESGVAAYRLPILFEMDKKRGTLLSGNALEFDKGTILCVGSGVLRVNGSAISASMTASRSAQVAIWQENSSNYLVQTLGFALAPTGISIAASNAAGAQNYTDANVTTGVGTSNIAIATHGFTTGQEVLPTTAGTLAAPLATNTNVYVIVVDANNIQLASTLANAMAGTEINFTSVGSGTTTLTPITKNMPAGDRSIRVAKASTKLGVPSFGNPGPKLKTTITAGQVITVTLPAMDSNSDTNNPHDAWRIYASAFGGTTANATANADSGAWYLVRTVSSADLGTTAATTYRLEYLDAEIDGTLRLITFDNDAPPDAEYVATVAGYPVLVSCQGKATVAEPTGTSPGPSLVPFKVSNMAAAPLVLDTGQRNEVPLSPPETIIGSYMAAGRLYLMTANTLQIAVFTADQDFPVATRPFWKAGFRNPYALCFVNGDLYGFTGNGPTRSSASENVGEGSEEHKFAIDVQEIMKDWKPENVFVVEDPKNECVCYVNSGGSKNSSGYWISEIVPFMPGTGEWSMPIVFTSATKDRIITGVATVNGRLEFLMGGRDGGGSMEVKTYRFDEVSGESVPYSQAWSYSDAGSEDRPKKIKNPRVVGKVTSATLGIFGAAAGEDIDITQFATGNSASKTGAIAIDTGTGVEYRVHEEAAINGLMTFAPQISGTWAGSGDKDRIDEISCDVLIRGGKK